MKKRCLDILEQSKSRGWVLEPEAKEIMELNGLHTCRNWWIKDAANIVALKKQFTYPVVAKVVSPKIMHKTEKGGVIKNLNSAEELTAAFIKLSSLEGFEGILVDEMISGLEIIAGAQDDPQFGKVVMIGIGGTSVEIYRDVAIRLAPLTEKEALSAIESLRGLDLLTGYRGAVPTDLKALAGFFTTFSKMVFNLGERFKSIDLNPVMCMGEKILIADARILL